MFDWESQDYLPHSFCFLASPGLMAFFVVSNILVTLAFVVGFPWAFYPWLRMDRGKLQRHRRSLPVEEE